jgi:DNA (cytosine-5)-methyltransferase 1
MLPLDSSAPSIPIIDLFAGPGGLGEGFSSLRNDRGRRVFNIKLSVEKDEFAHRTLELRAFTRQFPIGDVPEDYYEYVRGAPNITRDKLFLNHARESVDARREAWLAELGKTPASEVNTRILEALGSDKTPANWVLIGGPPCQAYSLLGRWRQKSVEAFDNDSRHFLYRQYLQIIADHQPPVFVMENVKGLLSTKVRSEGMAQKIFSDLRHPLAATGQGSMHDLVYRFFPLVQKQGSAPNLHADEFAPEDFIVHSEDHGIPQARHRVIILGVRSDWKKTPAKLDDKQASVSIDQVIGDLPRLRSGLSKENDSSQSWNAMLRGIPEAIWLKCSKLPVNLKNALEDESRKLLGSLSRGGRFCKTGAKPKRLAAWFHDPKLRGVCNHETRSHIRTDLHRYFYAAVFAREYGRSPVLNDFPPDLLPLHKNVEDSLRQSKFNDRFRVQLAGRFSTTVVSHISKDGHYYIHYDPTQCRSLTVREAARLQTFPDNYFFEGPRTEQYHQVGNAVPPLLAHQIAKVVAGLFE